MIICVEMVLAAIRQTRISLVNVMMDGPVHDVMLPTRALVLHVVDMAPVKMGGALVRMATRVIIVKVAKKDT